jgi:hypothetical protein
MIQRETRVEENTLRTEMKKDGYSKEEQYFYELNLKLTKSQKRESFTKDDDRKGRAIQRWETDGGLVKNGS